MIVRKLAIAGFTLATFALLFWLFANWLAYQMSDFDCPAFGSGSRECVDAGLKRLLLMVVPAVIGWLLLGWLTFREWKRH